MTFYLGLDLGQSQDYSALVIIEDRGKEAHLRQARRYKLGTPYPNIVQDVVDVLRNPLIKDSLDPILVVDATGVGAPVVDMFHGKHIVPYAVKIHGGDKVTTDGIEYRIPKRDLATNLQVYFQQKQLKIASNIEEVQVLTDELMNFKVKISKVTAHDSYEAWRERDHDDLVLAVAMACWFIKNVGTIVPEDFTANTEGWPTWED